MNKTIIVLMATLGLTALTGAGATPDLFDNFDGYSLGRTFTTTVNGWQTSAGGVMVTNDTAHSGTQSVTLPVGTDLTNLVSGGSGKVIWTDFFMKPAMGDTPPEFSTDGASLCLYFGTNGYAALVTAAGEQVLSNDVWGTALAPATTNFVRLTVYQNYATSKQAVLIDGRLVAQDLPFVTPVATYDTLRLLNGSTNAWVDDVWVKTTYDTATLTNDANTNGMSDAAELALYGYAARTLYVGVGSGQPQYPTFQTAISAWRPHDALYVYAGNYTNDVLATNSLTFSGNAFTNTGTLTVSANASVTFPSAMTWGNVTVDTNSTAVFGAALTCSNLVVATGATATFYAVTCSNVFVASGAHATFLGTLVCAGTCTLDTGATAGFSNTVVCAGAVTIGNNAAVACGQSLTCGALAVSAGATGTFQAVTCASVFVATGAHVTGLGALACTGACTLDLGAAASFSNTVVCAGNLTVGTNATFTAGQSVTCSNLYAWTGATGTFQAVTCTNLTAQTGVHLTAAGAVSSATDCTLGSGDVATFGGTLGCGGNLTVGTNDLVTVAQGLTCGNLYISANATGTFHAVTCASLVTEAGVHLTFLNTLLCAADCTIGANASVGFSNTVTCASLAIQAGAQVAFQGAFLCTGNSSIVAATVAFNGAVSCGGVWLVDANANVTFGQSAALATLNVNGTLMLAGGGALSANSVTVTGLVQVAVAGTVNVTNLTVTGGGQLQFTNGQFVVTGAGVNMAGTFTINNTWGQAAAVPLPFADGFELYASGTRLVDLGFRGWGARDTNVVVQSVVVNGGSRAACLQDDAAVSNRLVGGPTHIWTDLYLRPQPGLGRPDLPTNGVSFVSYVDSNGWLEVASAAGWIVCSNLYNNNGVPQPMTTQTWTRLTVFQDFVQKKEAIFLDGKLAREQVPFLDGAISADSSVEVNNDAGPAYLDDVAISTNLPAGLDGDLDGDGYPDAREIDRLGSVTIRNDWIYGTTFKFR